MALSLYQKSVYMLIFGATMIARSIGKTIGSRKKKDKLIQFKTDLFKQLEQLIFRLDKGTLKEHNIVTSIGYLSKRHKISIGQTQKPINVILKYHYYLSAGKRQNKKVFHCPLDSVILESIGQKSLSLAKMDKEKYIEIQDKIQSKCPFRIEYDKKWDMKFLKRHGIL